MKLIAFCLLLWLVGPALVAQPLVTYDWPTGNGEALLSDKYKVTIAQGATTLNSMVIKSNSKDLDIPDYAKEFRGGRTLNWTMFSADFKQPVTITVEKLFGDGAASVEVVPSPFNIKPTVEADGKKISFTLDAPKYVSVNFKTADNLHTSDGVVKHMLMIFADTLETNVPSRTAANVHVYSKASTLTQLNNADIIYFPKGYHDLSIQYNNISNLAPSINKKGKQVYFEGGAYVHGRISGAGQSNVKVFGRGVLSGRGFKWSQRLKENGGVLGVDSFDPIEAHIDLGKNNAGFNTIEGIIVCDGAGHGVNLGHDAVYRNVKLWGWHPNNDGFRPWGTNNIIDRCFIRPCDDALYNKGLTVTNTVFWPGFNGSVVCLGWDGPYNTENSKLDNNYLIYPEWRGLGNNNGIVMSQLDYDMKGVEVTIRNLTVDGNIPALVNLHTNTSKQDFNLPTDFSGKVGEVRNIMFENVKVMGRQVTFDGDAFEQTPVVSKGVIKGAKLTNGDIFYVSNVSFKNVEINRVCFNKNTIADYITIDAQTTRDISLAGCNELIVLATQSPANLEIKVSPNPSSNSLTISGTKSNAEYTVRDMSGKTLLTGRGTQVDVQTLPAGLYLLTVETTVVKFMKQ